MPEQFLLPHDIKPLEVQKHVLDKISYFYQKNNIGKLVWACGLGKSLFSPNLSGKLLCKTYFNRSSK